MDATWDCIVVGGGAAGLSAALVLGRARRTALVVDGGAQSNLPSHGIGGLLGHDGRSPAAFYTLGRDQLAAYPSVTLRTGTVVTGRRRNGHFELDIDDGTRHGARRVLLATGMEYRHPSVRGLDERWGRSVFHCPFCHGWEVQDRVLGVLDKGPPGVHRALLLRIWSDDVTLLTNGPSELDDEERRRLGAAGVVVDERPVAELCGLDDTLTAIRFADGGERPCAGLLVPVTLHQRSSLAAELGARAADPGQIAVDAVDIDAMFQTSAPGVLAAGDLSCQMPSVANAVAAGSNAAATVVRGLAGEDFGL